MNSNIKYLIAIIPPEPVLSEINNFKNSIKEKYSSKGALNSPPHITLHMPFELSEKKMIILKSTLEKIAQQHLCFELFLNDFGFFEPRVVFVAIEKKQELVDLQKMIASEVKLNLFIFNANYRERVEFKPHITVAFRDLKKDKFYAAKKEFEILNYQRKIKINSFFLLEKKDKIWETKQEFLFANL